MRQSAFRRQFGTARCIPQVSLVISHRLGLSWSVSCTYPTVSGSLAFLVGSACQQTLDREAWLPEPEEDDGPEVGSVSEAPSGASGRLDDGIEPFREGIGGSSSSLRGPSLRRASTPSPASHAVRSGARSDGRDAVFRRQAALRHARQEEALLTLFL